MSANSRGNQRNSARKRQTVDETGDVRPSPVEIVLHPQLAHAKKFVVFRRIEIEVPQPLPQAVGGGLLDEGIFGVVHASPFVPGSTANRFITRRTIRSLAFGSLSAISSVSAVSAVRPFSSKVRRMPS